MYSHIATNTPDPKVQSIRTDLIFLFRDVKETFFIFWKVDEMCVRVPDAVDTALWFPPQPPGECPQTGLSSLSAPVQQPVRQMEAQAGAQ